MRSNLTKLPRLSPFPKLPLRTLVTKAGAAVLSLIGLVWGLIALPTSGTSDYLRALGEGLLRSKTYNAKAMSEIEMLASPKLGACDVHAHNALLLIEIRLAEISLRIGDVSTFDQKVEAAKARVGEVLRCSPRQSFIWLSAFGIEVLQGRLSERTFAMLKMSYETSPNEAWIAIRRNPIASRFLSKTDETLRQMIIVEFEKLVTDGFYKEAAHSFLNASEDSRNTLEERIKRLELTRQTEFWASLRQTSR